MKDVSESDGALPPFMVEQMPKVIPGNEANVAATGLCGKLEECSNTLSKKFWERIDSPTAKKNHSLCNIIFLFSFSLKILWESWLRTAPLHFTIVIPLSMVLKCILQTKLPLPKKFRYLFMDQTCKPRLQSKKHFVD